MSHDPHTLPVVLVVEDEPLIRMEAVDMIQDAGFQTCEAGSADAAIKLLDQRDDIGVLFTDIDMPGSMNGLKLAAYVSERRQGIAIMVASGVVGIAKKDLPEGAMFFPKPYPTSMITNALRLIAKSSVNPSA